MVKLMEKNISLIIIFISIISCSSQFNSNSVKGPEFRDRVGNYRNTDSTITVTINDKDKDNLVINISNPQMDETISMSPYSTSKYVNINSKKYAKYVYSLGLLKNTENIFLTLRDDKGQAVIFNEKLTIVK